jgi:peptide/nickel transport system substrate-binding protein
MRRPLTTLLAAFAALAAAACAPDSDQALDVTVIGKGHPVIADPSTAALSAPSEVLLVNAAQGLVRFDADGQIEPGLAERWNVSDDGLSYIFRIAPLEWAEGRPASAREVARILNSQLRSASRNPLKDGLGFISEIVAMTDRVIEIRLKAARPDLLQLLAQPQMAIVRNGHGTGPFQVDPQQDAPGAISLTRRIQIVDDKDRIEHVHLRSAAAEEAVAQFQAGKTALVLGGSFVDLPAVPRGERQMRNALRFDPVAGLFGLRPARSGGPLADRELRILLNRAINREALIAALEVPNLVPRATLLQAGLVGGAVPVAPDWATQDPAQRLAGVIADARGIVDQDELLTIAIALPEGRGADILFNRLASDWRPLGIELVRAGDGIRADLTLVDQVAPSTSAAWFVRNFRCGVTPLCSEDADKLMDSARDAEIPAQRAAMLAEAGRLIDADVLFMAIAAPIRWSLVGDGLPGFAENIFARHPLSGLREKPSLERQ